MKTEILDKLKLKNSKCIKILKNKAVKARSWYTFKTNITLDKVKKINHIFFKKDNLFSRNFCGVAIATVVNE